MESQIWHLPAGSMAPWREGSEKGQWPLLALLPDTSLPPCMPLCLSRCNPGAGVHKERVWVSPCVGSLRGTTWDSSSFFSWLSPCWFLQPKIVGTYLPVTGTLGWGIWCGAWAPCSWDIYPKFLSTTRGCGTSPFYIFMSPTSLDGCGFFKSVVVRLLFIMISDGSEWWFFYILVVILMWSCEEVSHVCLRCHHDRKPDLQF